MVRKLGLLAAIAAMSMTSSAWACRTLVPNAAELAKYDNLAVVSIQTGSRVENPGWNQWRLTARTLHIVAGSANVQTYNFSTTQSSDGCGRTPLPTEGETWAVYSDGAAPDRVLAAFPLLVARAHDPRLATVR